MYIQPPIETIIIMLQGVLYAEPFSWSQQLYHSIHARGENVEDILREEETAAELDENEDVDNGKRQPEDGDDPEMKADGYVDAGNDDEDGGNMPTAEPVSGAEAESTVKEPDIERGSGAHVNGYDRSDASNAGQGVPMAGTGSSVPQTVLGQGMFLFFFFFFFW